MATDSERKTGSDSSKTKGPEGGFDDTPVPRAPPGYTVKIIFHRAINLPFADINTLSADPFIHAEISTNLPPRHKMDPPLALRTPTVRENTNPVWDAEWIVANIPASGFKMKCRIYDEDPADHDDRLGNAHVDIGPIDENFAIKDREYPIKKRMASKRAQVLRGVAVCLGQVKHMTGSLFVSVEVLGKTDDENGGRTYTIGPQYWLRHQSPMLGRLLGQKEPGDGTKTNKGKEAPGRYNFQANEMQLRGPVPEAMYHRYVEFRPFVKAMFTAKGVRGYILSKTLHHQHARVYNFDANTQYEKFEGPCKEFAQKFLELVHYDKGGRIFTYVLTLDALFRFTETGKEFGIDMLSKHTMHSEVAAYVAFSGEFFIRRAKHAHRNAAPEEASGSSPSNTLFPPDDEFSTDPAHYELFIDNDSGTYRPNAKLLPQLKDFFEMNFPGLKVVTLDSQGDAEKMAKLKEEQREKKTKEGDQIIYMQASDTDSLSSSDYEGLDAMEETGAMPARHFRHQVLSEAGMKVDGAKEQLKELKLHNAREGWRNSKAMKESQKEKVPGVEDPLERIRAEHEEVGGKTEAQEGGNAKEGGAK